MYCKWSCWKNKPCIHYHIPDELDTCIEDRILDELQAVLVTEIDYWPPELHSRTAVAAVSVVAWKLQKLTLQKKNKKPKRRQSAKKQ